MRVFISWSGQQSEQVAHALRDWLPNVIQALDPWVSSSDIEKGETWFASISESLVKAEGIGIFCLTRENVHAQWLAYEAGALAGSDRARVATFRFNVSNDELKPPLSLFQATDGSSKQDVFKLVEMLNRRLASPLKEDRLRTAFATHWDRLEQALREIAQSTTVPSPPAQSPTDLIHEVLAIVRRIERDRLASTPPPISLPAGGILGGYGGPTVFTGNWPAGLLRAGDSLGGDPRTTVVEITPAGEYLLRTVPVAAPPLVAVPSQQAPAPQSSSSPPPPPPPPPPPRQAREPEKG